ncbi:MAG: methyltransferase domain-containing protein [Candidatus Diapherotrites archaeon]
MSEAKKYYNELAKKYDTYVPMLPQYRRLVNEVVKGIKADKNSRVLDVGIGTGFSATSIYKKHKPKIFGVDISEEMLKKCRKNTKGLGADFVLKKANAKKLGFEGNYFDFAVSSLTLHHLDDKEKLVALKEIYRVLKKGGKVIIGEVLVDVEGGVDNPKRLKHILGRWSYASENALKYAGPFAAGLEIEAMLKVYRKERELCISGKKWLELMKKAGFTGLKEKTIDKKLGWSVFSGFKK